MNNIIPLNLHVTTSLEYHLDKIAKEPIPAKMSPGPLIPFWRGRYFQGALQLSPPQNINIDVQNEVKKLRL